VSYLIDNGANVNIKNKAGKTALFYAIENCDDAMVKFLVLSEKLAVTQQDIEHVDLLLKTCKKKKCACYGLMYEENVHMTPIPRLMAIKAILEDCLKRCQKV